MDRPLNGLVSLDRLFPVLAVADLDAAVEYYTVALGFHELWRWGNCWCGRSRPGRGRVDPCRVPVMQGVPSAGWSAEVRGIGRKRVNV